MNPLNYFKTTLSRTELKPILQNLYESKYQGIHTTDGTIHFLKIESQYLNDVTSGKKKAEIRFNDRNFKLGDYIQFIEVKENELIITSFTVKITHILDDSRFLKDNFVMLSIMNL